MNLYQIGSVKVERYSSYLFVELEERSEDPLAPRIIISTKYRRVTDTWWIDDVADRLVAALYNTVFNRVESTVLADWLSVSLDSSNNINLTLSANTYVLTRTAAIGMAALIQAALQCKKEF